MNLIRNAIQTPDGTVLVSRSRHDYKTHTDANGKTYMVDGGLEYVRRSAHGDEVDLCLYDDAPHIIQASVLKWGTYGINQDQPLKYVTIAEMDTAHIEAVLKANVNPVHKACMVEELKRREEVCIMTDREELEEMNKINRLEVIDQTGRAYVHYLHENEDVRYSLQDDNRTLKIFIDKYGSVARDDA